MPPELSGFDTEHFDLPDIVFENEVESDASFAFLECGSIFVFGADDRVFAFSFGVADGCAAFA